MFSVLHQLQDTGRYYLQLSIPSIPRLNELIPMILCFVTGTELALHKDSPIRADESATEARRHLIYSDREVRL